MGLAPDILNHMDVGGHVILSGILKEQKNTVATHFNGYGLDIIDDEPQGEWVSLMGRKSVRCLNVKFNRSACKVCILFSHLLILSVCLMSFR